MRHEPRCPSTFLLLLAACGSPADGPSGSAPVEEAAQQARPDPAESAPAASTTAAADPGRGPEVDVPLERAPGPTIPFGQPHGYEALLPDLRPGLPPAGTSAEEFARRRLGDKMIDRMLRGMLDPASLAAEDQLVYAEAMARFEARQAAAAEAEAAGDGQDG